MKTSEKIIKRLYDMGAIGSLNATSTSFRGSHNGSWCWSVSCGHHVGSCSSMKECLSWKRWLYSAELQEIFEYIEGVTSVSPDDIVEK